MNGNILFIGHTGCPKKRPLRIFRKDWMIQLKTVFSILKLVVYPRHLKKEISILSHIEEKLRTRQF